MPFSLRTLDTINISEAIDEVVRAGDIKTINLSVGTPYDLQYVEDSVDLVVYAFEHGRQGDIFVQKSPASTVADLAHALKKIFKRNNAVKIIGTRHGEKLYESLISREEMAKAIDLGGYYRIPADNRDLNYNIFVNVGEEHISDFDDYTSHNTKRLNVEQVESLLLKLAYIQDELHA